MRFAELFLALLGSTWFGLRGRSCSVVSPLQSFLLIVVVSGLRLGAPARLVRA